MFIEHNLPHQGIHLIHLKVSCARSTLSATVAFLRRISSRFVGRKERQFAHLDAGCNGAEGHGDLLAVRCCSPRTHSCGGATKPQ